MTITVGPGEILGLVGPSGAGKTTLLRCICGLHVPSKGLVTVDDQDMARVPVAKRPIAFMQQAYALYDQLTVLENVLVAHGGHRAPRGKYETALELLQFVGIPRQAFDRRPGTLSGGESQRIALCKALLKDARVLLLDEPFSNLDKRRRRDLGEFVRGRAKRHGVSVIIVSHDELDIMFLADRVCILQEGRIVQDGTFEDLRKAPLREQVASFGVETGLQIILAADLDPASAAALKKAVPTLLFDGYLAWRPDCGELKDATGAAPAGDRIFFKVTIVRSIPATGGDFLQLRADTLRARNLIWHFQPRSHFTATTNSLNLHLRYDDVLVIDPTGRVHQ
jgi:ABC-type multidrug transport system ATPase subunit